MARRTILTTLIVLALPGSPATAGVVDRLKDAIPFKGFTVDGRKGAFIKQIETRSTPPVVNAAGPLGFGALEEGSTQSLVIRMPQTERQLAALAATLDDDWPANTNRAPPRFRIVGNDNYQAAAFPDGSINLNFGVLSRATTDDEVVFILAHELTHIRLNHFARAQDMSEARQFVTQVNSLYQKAVAVSQMRVRASGETTDLYTADPKLVAQAEAQAAANKRLLDLLINAVIESPWARADEDEADAAGFDLAYLNGYSAEHGYSSVLRNTRKDYDAASQMAEIAKSQLTASGSTLATEAISIVNTGSGSLSLAEQFAQAKATLSAGAMNILGKFLSQDHRSPEGRQKGLLRYSAAAYKTMEERDPKSVWLRQVQSTPEFKSALVAMQSTEAAEEALRKGDAKAAVVAVGPALKTSYANQAFVANLAGRVYSAVGDLNASERYYTIADKDPGQTLDGYEGHINMLLGARRYPRALEVANLGVSRLKDERPLLPSLLAISFHSGKQAETALYMQKCLATENEALKARCVDALTSEADKKKYAALPAHLRLLVDTEREKDAAKLSVLAGLKAADAPSKGEAK